jgi:hypothetical protein
MRSLIAGAAGACVRACGAPAHTTALPHIPLSARTLTRRLTCGALRARLQALRRAGRVPGVQRWWRRRAHAPVPGVRHGLPLRLPEAAPQGSGSPCAALPHCARPAVAAVLATRTGQAGQSAGGFCSGCRARGRAEAITAAARSQLLPPLPCPSVLKKDSARLETGIPDDDWFCRSCLAKFGAAGPPAWTAFGPDDACVACFEDEKRPGSKAKWICKIRFIEGTKAFVHFPGWKDKHDLWVQRSALEPLPPEGVLARAQRSRLMSEEEETNLLRKEEKKRKAKEMGETVGKIEELDKEKKQLHKLIQTEKNKTKTNSEDSPANGKAPETAEAGSGDGAGQSGQRASEGFALSEVHADLVAKAKRVGEQIKELRRSLPPSHELYLAPPASSSFGGGEGGAGGARRGVGSKEGKEVGPEFSSRVTTLDLGDANDGWNDYCLECGGGDSQLICCDACPRAYCFDCAKLSKEPRGKWYCKPCINAKQMLATGGGIGSDKLLLQIQRLCEQFPMTHFLGVLAFDLARVRTSAEYCRENGISLNGMHQVATAREALERLDALLDANKNGAGSASGASTAVTASPQAEANATGGGGGPVRGPVAQTSRFAIRGPGQESQQPASSSGKDAGAGGKPGGKSGGNGKSGSKKHVAASAMSGKFEFDPRYKEYEEIVTQFYQEGVCVPKDNGLTETQVESVKEAVERYYNDVKFTIQQKQLQSELEAHGWETFKLRCPGRYDMQVPDLEDQRFKFLREDAPWMDAVHAILGSDCKLHYMGCMLSQPNSSCQHWHSDGDHLSDDEHLPAYAVNVFVPLIDMDPSL